MKYQNFDIKTKLAIFVFCVLSITILICMAIANSISLDLLRVQKTEWINVSTQKKAQSMRQYLVGQKNDVLVLTKIPQLYELIQFRDRSETDSSSDLSKNNQEIYHELTRIYADIIKTKSSYFKVRYIDQTGQEVIHITNQDGKTTMRPDTALRYQGDTDYFQKTALLNKGQIYVSSIHLHQETRQVNSSKKPVIQFATPVFTADQERKGIIILTIHLKDIVEKLVDSQKEGNIYLINNKGYFLFHHDRKKEWGQEMAHQSRIQYDYDDQKLVQGLTSLIPYSATYEDKILCSEPLFLSEDNTYYLKVIQEYPEFILLETVKQRTLFLVIVGFLAIIISVVLGISFANVYVKKLILIHNRINDIIQGKDSDVVVVKGNDEIDQLQRNTNVLVKSLHQMTVFAQAVEKGDYHSDEKFDSDVVLGDALMKMRDSLQKADQEGKINEWTTKGQNLFNEILRNYTDIQELAEKVLIELIKYLEVNQGLLFLVNTEGSHLDLYATYAWSRQKFLHKSVAKGEGLIGEVWQEGQMIYLREIPENYVEIKSGLGGKSPEVLLIIPIKNNDETIGIIELASFTDLETYKIDFIQFVCQITGIAFSNIFNHSKTEMLLEEAQKYAETFRVQEEEMRQNTEELFSTQEEMRHQIRDYEARIATLKAQVSQLQNPEISS